jgi:hypothetical protein
MSTHRANITAVEFILYSWLAFEQFESEKIMEYKLKWGWNLNFD